MHDLVAGADRLAAELGVGGGGAPDVDDRGWPSARSPRPRSGATPSKSAAHSARWSGCSVSSFRPQLMALRVVSLPATTSRMKKLSQLGVA